MIGSVITPPAYTVPVAAVVFVWIIWYWRRLSVSEMPESRRRIRRALQVVMLVGLMPLVAGLSFLDNEHQPDRYIGAWILVMALLAFLLVLAMVDILNNLRVHVRESQEGLGESRTKLRRAIREYEKDRDGGADANADAEDENR